MPEGDTGDLADGVTLATGGNNVIGPWSFHALEHTAGGSGRTVSRRATSRLDYLALPTEGQYDYILHVKELMLGIMYEQLERNPSSDKFQLYLPNGATTGSNLALFQVTVTIPSTVDFVFLSHRRGVDPNLIEPVDRVTALSGDSLSALLKDREQAFDAKFHGMMQDGLVQRDRVTAEQEETGEAREEEDTGMLEMTKGALSNLLGSMSYSYGSAQVRLPRHPSTVETLWPSGLYSAVPSRTFLPRGSLWDEGFHQLMLQRWDPQISRDSLAHWLDLMNLPGWLPGEVVLGEEAASQVGEEAVPQDPRLSPPSLFMPLMEMAGQLQRGATQKHHEPELVAIQAFLRSAWPRLVAWYSWHNTTQQGSTPGTFRWRGRNSTTALELNPKTLGSGMDDYPRASHPTPDERHLDLRCWMAFAADTMVSIGEVLHLPEDSIAPFRSSSLFLRNMSLLQQLHQDPSTGHFLDYGLHSDDVGLQRHNFPVEGQIQEITYRIVHSPPTLSLVPCFGYVSLFPLLLRLLPHKSEELGRQLKMLQDPQLLWTDFGLRSVSPHCSLYRKYNTAHDPPRWRGSIWLNVNYLALMALRHYKDESGPWAAQASKAHYALRRALLKNLAAEYAEWGYLSEQYDDVTGRGFGSHPYSGWTALAALAAAKV